MKNIEKRQIIIGGRSLGKSTRLPLIAVQNKYVKKYLAKHPCDHELKIEPFHFNEVKEGRKHAEFRRGDRDYKVGDYLTLREFNSQPTPQFGYTGRSIICQITNIVFIH
ncbi:DUF3850 domain-containing protein [Providencia sp. PROV091]|uniref:DUF3850 domain-containing protein n=1 Tax=Providencia sp. PROV091 TaxID=2949807 RepID=UPI00234A7890|nr:DUF3850 domain-containing protein [Providencia sp. PROV091]